MLYDALNSHFPLFLLKQNEVFLDKTFLFPQSLEADLWKSIIVRISGRNSIGKTWGNGFMLGLEQNKINFNVPER